MNEVHDVPLSRRCSTKKIVDLCFDFIWLLSFFYSLRTFFDERQMSTYNFSSELVVKRHYKQYSQLVVVGEAQLYSTDNKFL